MAVNSHQRNLAILVDESLTSLPDVDLDDGQHDAGVVQVRAARTNIIRKRAPDFVSVTRGPGITAALATGLETAKGLAVAWQVPLVGVNHMQAHALTPRLVSAIKSNHAVDGEPRFPYLSLLVSGGHTMIVLSQSLCAHRILANTADIAVGDAIDKMARSILPAEEFDGQDPMYGRVLEKYASLDGPETMQYVPPASRKEEITPKVTDHGWALPIPFGEKRNMTFSFSGIGSAIKRICDAKPNMHESERVALAIECMRVSFEHLALRVVWAIERLQEQGQDMTALVISGGVASNGYLRKMFVQCSE